MLTEEERSEFIEAVTRPLTAEWVRTHNGLLNAKEAAYEEAEAYVDRVLRYFEKKRRECE